MKTISGQIISTKEVTLSKAAKILSKFLSAENGSSQAISAYLHRASTAFNELNQLHKELKLSSSSQKHKSHRTDNANQDNEKSSQTVFKSSQDPNLNASIGSHSNKGNEGGSEKHKNKKKQQEIDYWNHGDPRVESEHGEGEVKVPIETQNAIESSDVHGCEGESYAGMEARKKQKKEKRKKKNDSKSEVENLEVESAMGSSRHQKEIEKELGNHMEVENGGLVDPQETQIKKKTKNGLLDEEAKLAQKKKRKNENEEDRPGYVSNKRQKRKQDGD